MGIRLEVEGTDLVVRLDGPDVAWALRRQLRIPLDAIVAARAVPRTSTRRVRMRVWGYGFPGLRMAGSFRSRGRREFWSVYSGRTLLEIACAPDERYDLVYLEVPEPERIAGLIRAEAGIT